MVVPREVIEACAGEARRREEWEIDLCRLVRGGKANIFAEREKTSEGGEEMNAASLMAQYFGSSGEKIVCRAVQYCTDLVQPFSTKQRLAVYCIK